MNKSIFHIGDRVNIFDQYGSTGVVTDVCITSEGKEILIIWGSYPDEFGEIENCFNDYEVHEVELIPHPDTERLNWLFTNGMSKVSKEVVFGKNVNHSNFRSKIDRLNGKTKPA